MSFCCSTITAARSRFQRAVSQSSACLSESSTFLDQKIRKGPRIQGVGGKVALSLRKKYHFNQTGSYLLKMSVEKEVTAGKASETQVNGLEIKHHQSNNVFRKITQLPPILTVGDMSHHPFSLTYPTGNKHMHLLFILFLVQERKKLVVLRLVSNLSQIPAAATITTPPYPLPGRQHLIKMARTLGSLPRRSVLGLGVGVGKRRSCNGVPGSMISKQQQNGF